MAKKLTRAEKIRRYITENPTAKTTEIAKHFETRYQNVYAVRRKMETPRVKKAEVATKKKWETVGVFSSNTPMKQDYIDKKAQEGVDKYWKAVGEVQKAGLSPERIAELTIQAGKPKARMQGNIDNINAGTTVGGLTLTSVGNGKMRWVKNDPVNNPAHYKVGGIETIDFIEAKNLGYNLGNAVKYITRSDHKGNKLEDLRKAQWYLEREVYNAENRK